MLPWYKNFKGSITKDPNNGGSNYIVKGKWKQLDKRKIEITELPVKKWTRDYKNFLEELAQKDPPEVDDIREYH